MRLNSADNAVVTGTTTSSNFPTSGSAYDTSYNSGGDVFVSIIDIANPQPVTNIDADPGHEKVTVTWDDPSSGDISLLEIYRGLWHDGSGSSIYPEYDDDPNETIPTRPTDRAAAVSSSEWTLAGTVNADVETFEDEIVDRGVYYYEIFVKDSVGKFSQRATANDRATNYWLGDLTYDGYVTVADFGLFAGSYNTSDGDPGYDNECDFGPTDDATSFGVPETDDEVDAVDYAIFGSNFNQVAPRVPPTYGTISAILAWEQVDSNRWQLRLTEQCKALKLVRAFSSTELDDHPQVTPGNLLEEQLDPYLFYSNPGNALDVNAVVAGPGNCIHGSGVLFEIECHERQKLERPNIELLGPTYEPVAFKWISDGADEESPFTFSSSNHPNPFNPSTTIKFSLPTSGRVEIAIFGVDGRRVASLLDEDMTAGRHSIVWDGSSDNGYPTSSGVYWYRISTGVNTAVEKIVLLK